MKADSLHCSLTVMFRGTPCKFNPYIAETSIGQTVKSKLTIVTVIFIHLDDYNYLSIS